MDPKNHKATNPGNLSSFTKVGVNSDVTPRDSGGQFFVAREGIFLGLGLLLRGKGKMERKEQLYLNTAVETSGSVVDTTNLDEY